LASAAAMTLQILQLHAALKPYHKALAQNMNAITGNREHMNDLEVF
jgi:hypothetical protein